MSRTITITKTVYQFDELSDSAKAKALEKQSELESEFFAPDYDDFESIAKILGITFHTNEVKLMNGNARFEPNILWSGFSSQGDGACFEGTYEYVKGSPKLIRAYAPTDKELHRIADNLQALQKPCFYGLTAYMTHSGQYSHSGCMDVDVEHKGDDAYNYRTWQARRDLPSDDLCQLMRDFANWMYRSMREDYDYRTGYEACREAIDANEYEFTEDGNIA